MQPSITLFYLSIMQKVLQLMLHKFNLTTTFNPTINPKLLPK
jgi:hypothetical protein